MPFKKLAFAAAVALAGLVLLRASLQHELAPSPEPAAESQSLGAPLEHVAPRPAEARLRISASNPTSEEAKPSAATTGSPNPTEAADPSVISGRVLLMDGTPVAQHTVWAKPEDEEAGGLPIHAQSNAQGEFTFAGLLSASYTVMADHNDKFANAKIKHVTAPTRNLEIRVDAVLLAVHMPGDFDLDALAAGGTHSVARITEAGLPEGYFAYGGLNLDQDGTWQKLLPVGPGYLVRIALRPNRHFAALLPAGSPSGTYDLELRAESPALASVEVVLTGAEIVAPARLTVRFGRLVNGASKLPLDALRFNEGERQGRTGIVLPGEYQVEASIFGPPPKFWILPRLQTRTLSLAAGDSAIVEVQLVQGGGLTITPSSLGTTPPPSGMALQLESFDEDEQSWKVLPTYRPVNDGYVITDVSEIGTLYLSQEPLPTGLTRFRLTGKGYRTVETELPIRTAQLTAWEPTIEPLVDEATKD